MSESLFHDRKDPAKWWLFRKHPVKGWQYWSTYDGAWDSWTSEMSSVGVYSTVGSAPGDQVLSYASTWAEPELELEETA